MNEIREWLIHSCENDYVLYAPDGSKVGHYKSLEDAKQAARDLQQLALEAKEGGMTLDEGER